MEYPAKASDYELLGEIGQGGFATVYKALVKGTGVEVAVKVIDLEVFNAKFEDIRKEITMMRSMNHPNVVKV